MISEFEIFELIQDKKLIEQATNTIMQSELSGKHFAGEFEFNGQRFRYRAKDTGTYNIDYFTSYELNFESLSYRKKIEFFRPLGYYFFDNDLKLVFWILNTFKSVSLNQDNHTGFKKNINIFYSRDNPMIDPIIEGFSVENKFILTSLDELIQKNKVTSIIKRDTLFLTKEFTIYPSIGNVTFRYLTTSRSNVIQVYVENSPSIKFPILGFTSDKNMVVNPMFK